MGLFDFLFGPPSRDTFGRRMIEAARHIGVTQEIHFEQQESRLRIGKDQVVNLHNLYDEYCQAPKNAREGNLQRAARALLQANIPERLEDALPNLVPRVRDRFFYESLLLHLKIQGTKVFDVAHEPLAEHFAVELAYDEADAIATISSEQLLKWGVTLHEMMERCLPLLENATRRKLKTVRHGLYVADWKDNYDASRILLKDFIRRHEVHGEPVVAIPNRDTLILTGSQDESGLKRLVELVGQALQSPRPMFGPPMVLSEGAYVPMSPEPGSPAYPALREHYIQMLATIHHQQRELLDELNKKEGRDVYVAQFDSMRNKKTGLHWSWSSWAQGVPTYLPQSDLVALGPANAAGVPDSKLGFLVKWSTLQQVAGERLNPLDHYPKRFLVDTFPTPNQLQQLKKQEI